MEVVKNLFKPALLGVHVGYVSAFKRIVAEGGITCVLYLSTCQVISTAGAHDFARKWVAQDIRAASGLFCKVARAQTSIMHKHAVRRDAEDVLAVDLDVVDVEGRF